MNESETLYGIEEIKGPRSTERELIPNKLSETISELSSTLDNLGVDGNISENKKILKLMDYILHKIYFDPDKREEEFQKLKNNPEATHEEITEFLEKENNMDIS